MVGNPVSKKAAGALGLFCDYDGGPYWFCCAGYGPTFDSDPAKYAANMACSFDAPDRGITAAVSADSICAYSPHERDDRPFDLYPTGV
ncbi:hypothetical protein [Kocuria sp. cx-455]|uniref:hypothetical protein n=1 Tax=Kocuria sp. cx-455 TaxID=2771377 RepID=UPI003D765F4D